MLLRYELNGSSFELSSAATAIWTFMFLKNVIFMPFLGFYYYYFESPQNTILSHFIHSVLFGKVKTESNERIFFFLFCKIILFREIFSRRCHKRGFCIVYLNFFLILDFSLFIHWVGPYTENHLVLIESSFHVAPNSLNAYFIRCTSCYFGLVSPTLSNSFQFLSVFFCSPKPNTILTN